jgi:hypothetical protein
MCAETIPERLKPPERRKPLLIYWLDVRICSHERRYVFRNSTKSHALRRRIIIGKSLQRNYLQ